jgi:hypothetical protein
MGHARVRKKLARETTGMCLQRQRGAIWGDAQKEGSNMKIAVLVITVLLLSGCGGSKIDGTYCHRFAGCYAFRSNGTVLISTPMGTELEMKYEVDGNKIKLVDRQGNVHLVMTMLEDGSIRGPIGVILAKQKQ